MESQVILTADDVKALIVAHAERNYRRKVVEVRLHGRSYPAVVVLGQGKEGKLTYTKTEFAHGITYNGETLTLSEWARRVGIKHGALFSRLRNGWTVEEALTTPVGQSMRDARRKSK